MGRNGLFSVLLVVSTASAPGTASHVSAFRVTLHVFSGTPDPEWYIQRSNRNFESILDSVDGHDSTNLGSQLGYNGFSIDIFIDDVYNRTVDVGRCTRTKFEMLLLDSVKDLSPEGFHEILGDPVVKYVNDQIQSCLS